MNVTQVGNTKIVNATVLFVAQRGRESENEGLQSSEIEYRPCSICGTRHDVEEMEWCPICDSYMCIQCVCNCFPVVETSVGTCPVVATVAVSS